MLLQLKMTIECNTVDFVSIPQAVSAVATAGSRKPVFMRFQKLVLENLFSKDTVIIRVF